tara:strand:- start:4027 stop:6336 length:2310 start_codon:yes stop_codon:yes gene_type:complete
MFASDNFRFQVINELGEPIDGVNIEIIDNSIFTVTDQNGYFSINDIFNDKFSIKLKHLGYKQKIVNVDSNYQMDVLIINLEPSILELERTVITGLRKETYIKDTPVLTHVISSKDIENSAYTSVKDILETRMPNVQNVVSSHAGTSNNRVKIQGLDNKYMLFLVDGARVSGEFAGNLDFSMLNLSNVEKIEIVEGGMSSLYGSSAIGGVVNIITKKNKAPYWFRYSYLDDSPMVISESVNYGFNYKNFYYDFNKINQQTNGYDLTPMDITQDTGVLIKTLEEYKNSSIGHTLRYVFKDKYLLELNYKNYFNNIYQYENHIVQVVDQNSSLYPFYYYMSYKNNVPRFEDDKYSLKFIIDDINYRLKIMYNTEKYIKNSYFFNYSYLDCDNESEDFFCNNSDDLIKANFTNAINYNKNLLVQYDYYYDSNELTFGLEMTDDSYSSFNIYDYHLGDNNNDGQCGEGFPWDPDDCLVESIFDSVDDIKYFSTHSLFFGNQYNLFNGDKFSFSIRSVISKNYKDDFVYSMAYMLKRFQPYDLRFNYSRGFRIPAIKELYYNFQGHSPPVVGNPNLYPTSNDYISISIDRRDPYDSFSFELFYNDVKDMIGISSDVDDDGNNILLYNNFDHVVFSGLNCHYERIFDNQNHIKFVYNYTNSKSNNQEALELISDHSLRINYYYDAVIDKVRLAISSKYSGEKFILDGDDKTILDDYVTFDLISIFKLEKFLEFKVGCKNIFNYKDERRLLDDNYQSDILTIYDPGRRFIMEFILNF